MGRLRYLNMFQGIDPTIVEEVHKQFEQGESLASIHQYLKKVLGDKSPSYHDLRQYRLWCISVNKSPYKYETALAKQKEMAQQIEQVTKEITIDMQRLESPDIDITNKRILLESVLQKCYLRLQALEKTQHRRFKPSNEYNIVRYVAEIRAISETLLKLSGEMQEDTQKIVVNIVQSNIAALIKAAYNVIMKYCSHDKEAIKEELKLEMQKAAQESLTLHFNVAQDNKVE
jgi:hypothetical protein